MENKKNGETQGNTTTSRKIITGVLVLIVFLALALAARYLVGSVDIVELLKKLHGG